jgi:hypothetical protein
LGKPISKGYLVNTKNEQWIKCDVGFYSIAKQCPKIKIFSILKNYIQTMINILIIFLQNISKEKKWFRFG